ncbi:NUDIX domain-containing protein [Kocuria sabuli]|uniref:NUDIX domain-containing protein n=1 Tax=Kocuria sabuli TaxID=3071448 RepID=UPI0034D6A696
MLVDQFDVFLINLDGVVYRGDGPHPEVRKSLDRLRRRGRLIRFLTNDPRPTRKEVHEKLAGLGIVAAPDEIMTAGWATAVWLRQRGVTAAHVLGSAGLRDELAAQGVSHRSDVAAEAVVVGYDDSLTYRDLTHACALIRAGSRFVTTDFVTTFPSEEGPPLTAGVIASAISAATGRRPSAIGKPGPDMPHVAQCGLPEGAAVAVVVSASATDTAWAHRAGLPAIVVDPSVSQQPPPPGNGTEMTAPVSPEAVVVGLSGLFDPVVHARPFRPLTYAWPDDVQAAVAAVVCDEAGRVLLVRRVDNGKWGVPSGHVEVGETVAQAVVREVAEETGLQVEVTRQIGVYSDPASQVFTYPDGRVTQFVTTAFACTPTGQQVRPDGVEISQVGFFRPDDLPSRLLRMHPGWLTDASTGRTGTID